MRRLLVATGNPNKLREIAELLDDSGWTLVAQSKLRVVPAEETGLSFVENALLKARHAARIAGFGALADDSGIVVDALAGRPGIHSARYAGAGASDADNVAKLLAELEDVPAAARGAAYHCAIVLVRDAEDPVPLICEGRWRGAIAAAPRGRGGFGYDPVFLLPERGRTAAELTVAEKNALSHRGQALLALAARLGEVA